MTDSQAVPRPHQHYTEPSWLEVGDLQVAYRRKGTGDAVLFLHGAGATRMWLPFYERMAGSVDFIAPEHPGFGETAFPEWLQGMDDLVLHYREFLDVLALGRVHLVGFSLGGWIASQLAIFYPERFRSLTLIAPAGLRLPGHPMADLWAMPGEQIAVTLFSGNPGEYLEFLPVDPSLDEIAHLYSESITFARLAWAPRFDRKLDRRLPRLDLPTLVVGAEDDWIIPGAQVDRWAELIPGARKERIGKSHGLLMEEPDAAAEAILEHISGAGTQGAETQGAETR
jgi:pimeloyl-ACP methyl ester carboxylesterase